MLKPRVCNPPEPIGEAQLIKAPSAGFIISFPGGSRVSTGDPSGALARTAAKVRKGKRTPIVGIVHALATTRQLGIALAVVTTVGARGFLDDGRRLDAAAHDSGADGKYFLRDQCRRHRTRLKLIERCPQALKSLDKYRFFKDAAGSSAATQAVPSLNEAIELYHQQRAG